MVKAFHVKVLINDQVRDAIMGDPVVGKCPNRAWSMDLKFASACNNSGREYFTDSLGAGEFCLRPVVVEIVKQLELPQDVLNKLNW